MMEFCDECRNLHKKGEHLPRFRCWCPFDGEEKHEAGWVRATSAQGAACYRSMMWDQTHVGQPIAKGKSLRVLVLDEQGTLSSWKVRGELVPVYEATQLHIDRVEPPC